MSCSPFDLRDYYLKELTDPQQRQVEAHVKDCFACRQELDQLRLTQAALFSLRDEEIPQRIAFVSDPVFEPSGARRWWNAFWGSSGRLGFASAALLSAALLISSFARPSGSARGGISAAEVDRRIQQAESERKLRLVAESEVEYAKKVQYAMERSRGDLKYPDSN